MVAKVLVATPTWVQENGVPAMRPECAESVQMQVFNGEYEHLVTTDNPYPLGNRNVYHQYLRIRTAYLGGEWDALLTLEHDHRLPDAYALQRMYDTPAELVYAPYMLRHGMRVLSTWKYINDRNLGSSWSNSDEDVAQARAAVIWPVCGVGFGCTLMRRGVVERVPFREWTPMSVSAPDMPFAEDTIRAGIRPVGRFDVPVEHWDAGEWIDPYMTEVNREYIALVTANAYAGEEQRYISLKEGNRYPLPYDVAWDLARRGMVREADAAGSADAHDGQQGGDAGAQRGKPAQAERPRLEAKPAGGRKSAGRRGKPPSSRRA